MYDELFEEGMLLKETLIYGQERSSDGGREL